MTAIKGYVVRGKYKGRYVGISDLQGSAAGPREPHPFVTLDDAAERAIDLRRFRWSDVAISRVRDDGTEEKLPSYEEALAEIERLRAAEQFAWILLGSLEDPGATPEDETRAALDLRAALRDEPDPLAALEAAERRLLEAGGWRQIEPDAYGAEQWQHEKHGRECRMVALTIARRRLAAKGGA